MKKHKSHDHRHSDGHKKSHDHGHARRKNSKSKSPTASYTSIDEKRHSDDHRHGHNKDGRRKGHRHSKSSPPRTSKDSTEHHHDTTIVMTNPKSTPLPLPAPTPNPMPPVFGPKSSIASTSSAYPASSTIIATAASPSKKRISHKDSTISTTSTAPTAALYQYPPIDPTLSRNLSTTTTTTMKSVPINSMSTFQLSSTSTAYPLSTTYSKSIPIIPEYKTMSYNPQSKNNNVSYQIVSVTQFSTKDENNKNSTTIGDHKGDDSEGVKKGELTMTNKDDVIQNKEYCCGQMYSNPCRCCFISVFTGSYVLAVVGCILGVCSIAGGTFLILITIKLVPLKLELFEGMKPSTLRYYGITYSLNGLIEISLNILLLFGLKRKNRYMCLGFGGGKLIFTIIFIVCLWVIHRMVEDEEQELKNPSEVFWVLISPAVFLIVINLYSVFVVSTYATILRSAAIRYRHIDYVIEELVKREELHRQEQIHVGGTPLNFNTVGNYGMTMTPSTKVNGVGFKAKTKRMNNSGPRSKPKPIDNNNDALSIAEGWKSFRK